jgi:hypothetical protein
LLINKICFFRFSLAGTDLPDDDYTTIVPPIKQPNGTSRKLPNVPVIIEHKENDSSSKKGLCNRKKSFLIEIFLFCWF